MTLCDNAVMFMGGRSFMAKLQQVQVHTAGHHTVVTGNRWGEKRGETEDYC